ncbi:MAG: glycoside hydrolase family 3 C-terminal domain-containing protein [Clostridia bacterium]|nr:glycoside hydrolase family 3 C-terminal domain-containing protein [Clostridia bacterium]
MKHPELISKLTLEDKAKLCSGADFWHLKEVERLGLKPIMVCDGPHGLRKQNAENEKIGIGNSYPATCFPTAVTTACSWDRELLFRMGEALGEECIQEEVAVILGPGVNMKRSPLCGRNFEYFSEDPILAGEMGAAFINGVQSKGIGTALKHFAANSQEMNRMTGNSIVDERALREIYLTAFEIAVKKAQPAMVMNAYNQLNGTFCSENAKLQNDILRGEWGFDGAVVSDWGAVNNRVDGIKAGNDLEMPYSGGYNDKKIIDAVKSGELDEAVVDRTADRLIDIIIKAGKVQKKRYYVNEHNRLAKEVALNSIVLLKNDENILPITDNSKSIAVIGEMAKEPRYQGAGSSLVNPTKMCSAFDALTDAGLNIKYAKGYNKKTGKKKDESLIENAVEVAKDSDIVLLFIGLTEEYESEGFDRKHMKLPDAHVELIEKIYSVNRNIVVVLSGGSPVEMSWYSRVKGIVNTYLAGQAGALALADIITGKANPCGKLAETFPRKCRDNPTYGNYADEKCKDSIYKESIFIGYRYYDKAQKKVRFPFGFGLSYTTFEYSKLKVSKKKFGKDTNVTVTFTVKNTGDVAGNEIAQVYVGKGDTAIFRAPKELKGFEKIHLEPKEKKTVTIELCNRAFSFYNTATSDWCVENGEYEIMVGSSSRDILLTAKVTAEGFDNSVMPDYSELKSYFGTAPQEATDEEFKCLFGGELPLSPEKEKSDYNTTIFDKSDKGLGKFVCKAVDVFTSKSDDVNAGMMASAAMQTPVRNFITMSNGLFSEEMADGLLMIFDGDKPLVGTGKILKGVPHALVNLKKFLKSI